MKIFPVVVSALLLLEGSKAQDFIFEIPGSPFPIAINFEAVPLFAQLRALLRFLDFFGIIFAPLNDGCQETVVVDSFDLDDVFSQPFYPVMLQPNDFLPVDRLNCVVADDIVTGGLPNGYQVDITNFVIDGDGNIFGPDSPPSCAGPTVTPGKLLTGLCDLPQILGRDFWFIAVDEEFVITVGGQLDVNNGNGYCSNDVSGGTGGIILAARGSPGISSGAMDRAMAIFEEQKIDTSVLVTVNQGSIGGKACTSFDLPATAGTKFGTPRS